MSSEKRETSARDANAHRSFEITRKNNAARWGSANDAVGTVILQGDEQREDRVIIERPLEINLRYQSDGESQQRSAAVTMRTPGRDAELALGFLYNERIIGSLDDVVEVSACENKPDTIRVTLREGVKPGDAINDRQMYATSSCGVCGKGAIDQIWRSLPDAFPFERTETLVDASVLRTLSDTARERQTCFSETGGNHASALFTPTGELVALFEDVGRHNATDKLVGAWLLGEAERPECPILFLSGRISFELVQKSLSLGVEIIAAVGAPSSLAIDVADAFGVTLIGFLRPSSYNLYTGHERIRTDG